MAVGDSLTAAGIRHLFIKGPVVSRQFPRAADGIRHVSSDVDVWVDPLTERAVMRALVADGWETPHLHWLPSLADHAVVLTHDLWGLTVDVHRTFPGVGVAPIVAFEFLWARRSCLLLANRPVPVPARSEHCLLLMLHALRSPVDSKTQIIADRALAELGDGETGDLQRAVQTLGAGPALNVRSEFWGTWGSGWDEMWALRSGQRSGAAMWMMRLKAARSWRERLTLAISALVPRPRGQDRWRTGDRLRALPAHWARGASQLPAAVRQLRAARQPRHQDEKG